MVVDLDHSPEVWTYVWRFSLALFETNARSEIGSICVPARSWHISFHDDVLCSPEAVAKAMSESKLYFISTDELDESAFAPITTFGDLIVYRIVDVASLFSRFDPKSHEANYVQALLFGEGWGRVEPSRVWQMEKEVTLNLFVAASAEDRHAEVLIGAFIPDETLRQHVQVLANGVPVDDFVFTNKLQGRAVTIALPADETDRIMTVAFRVDELRSPDDWIGSGDKRMLGINLRRMRIVTGKAE